MYLKHKRKSYSFCYGGKLTYNPTDPYLYYLPDRVWRHFTPWGKKLLGQNDAREAPPALQERACGRRNNSPGPCTTRPARSQSTSPRPASSAAPCGCIWRWPAPAAAAGSDPETEDRRTPCSPAGPPAEPPSGPAHSADSREKMRGKNRRAVYGSDLRTHPQKPTQINLMVSVKSRVQIEM